MENSNVKENLEVLFEKFRNMIKVETVVGEAVQIGDTTLVPFVDVTFGFGTGTNHNTSNKKPRMWRRWRRCQNGTKRYPRYQRGPH